MRIIFCSECGEYSLDPATECDICDSALTEDGWAEVSGEDLVQLDYVDSMEYEPNLPIWEYEVVKLNSNPNAVKYNTELLNRMGDAGWELVSVESSSASSEARYGIFKRAWLPEEFL